MKVLPTTTTPNNTPHTTPLSSQSASEASSIAPSASPSYPVSVSNTPPDRSSGPTPDLGEVAPAAQEREQDTTASAAAALLRRRQVELEAILGRQRAASALQPKEEQGPKTK